METKMRIKIIFIQIKANGISAFTLKWPPFICQPKAVF